MLDATIGANPADINLQAHPLCTNPSHAYSLPVSALWCCCFCFYCCCCSLRPDSQVLLHVLGLAGLRASRLRNLVRRPNSLAPIVVLASPPAPNVRALVVLVQCSLSVRLLLLAPLAHPPPRLPLPSVSASLNLVLRRRYISFTFPRPFAHFVGRLLLAPVEACRLRLTGPSS